MATSTRLYPLVRPEGETEPSGRLRLCRPQRLILPGEGIGPLDWSPDGRSIAYLVGCDVRATTPDSQRDRSLVDLAKVRPDAATCDLSWSPDGTQLAAMVDRDVTDPKAHSSRAVFVLHADGRRARLLSPWSRQIETFGLTWQPVP
jgi:hypothetical protein